MFDPPHLFVMPKSSNPEDARLSVGFRGNVG